MTINLGINNPIIVEVGKVSYGWENMLMDNAPFLITIFIVLSAATVTYWSNRKSVASQNRIADQARRDEHKNRISEFRHSWLQEVRETAAQLCKVIHELQYNAERRRLAIESREKSKETSDETAISEFQNMVDESGTIINECRSEFYALSAKMKLLFKKDEEATREVFSVLDSIRRSIYNLNSMTIKDSQIDSFIEQFQTVLKGEWEVTKKRV